MVKKIIFILLGIAVFIIGSVSWDRNQPYYPREILQDAFSLEEEIPEAADIAYQNREGVLFTASAYRGRVQVLADLRISPRKVKKFIEQNGGTIVGQIPAAGIYLAKIHSGEESKLINRLFSEPWVRDAFPQYIWDPKANIMIDFGEYPLSIGSDQEGKSWYVKLPSVSSGQPAVTSRKEEGATHMDLVRFYQTGRMPVRIQSCIEKLECQQARAGVLAEYQLTKDVLNRFQNDAYIAVNLSLGPAVGGVYRYSEEIPEEKDEIVKNTRKAYGDFFASALQLFEGDYAPVKKTIAVYAAGNNGVNIGNTIPDSFEKSRLIMVGAIDESGAIARTSNYSMNPRHIIYAPSDLRVGTFSLGSQTSLAAPRISYLVDKILNQYPELVSQPEKLKNILFYAGDQKGKANVAIKKRILHKGREIEYFVIENPYSEKTLQNALRHARTELRLPPEDTKEAASPKVDVPVILPPEDTHGVILE
jgi:hypothetical protein